MHKIILPILMVTVLFINVISVFAGDFPEGLLMEDKAVVFFGEILLEEIIENKITVKPISKIKGDIGLEETIEYTNFYLVGDANIGEIDNKIYLMTKYDENNELYIFSVTSADTSSLKIEGIKGTDMWERLQEYLNNGRFEEEEEKRIARLKDTDTDIIDTENNNQESEEITQTSNSIIALSSIKTEREEEFKTALIEYNKELNRRIKMFLYVAFLIAIIVLSIVYLVKNKKRRIT